MVQKLVQKHTVSALTWKLKSVLEDKQMEDLVERARREAHDQDEAEKEDYPGQDWNTGKLEKLVLRHAMLVMRNDKRYLLTVA